MSGQKKDRLGRGLGALLGDYLEERSTESEIRKIPLESVLPNPFQPRRDFRESELADLSRSIQENGLLQPLVVRPSPAGGGRFELVAGERRLRAIDQLGWTEVPVVIREANDETLLVLALVENLQREALGPLEEAEGYRVLSEEFGLTQGEIARSVGKDRSTVANTLRLLKLPPSVRKLLEDGTLTMGHARALLAVEDPVQASELARKAAAGAWSVREVERRAARASGRPRRNRREVPTPASSPLLKALEEELCQVLGTRVRIRTGSSGKGVIEVPYHGAEDFERLFALIARREASDVVE